MPKTKIAITMDAELLRRVDRAVDRGVEPNRSAAIERAVGEFVVRMDRTRLARECARLTPAHQADAADASLADSAPWPAY